jgi:hypothetical protein
MILYNCAVGMSTNRERLRITSAGLVGIGTSSPQASSLPMAQFLLQVDARDSLVIHSSVTSAAIVDPYRCLITPMTFATVQVIWFCQALYIYCWEQQPFYILYSNDGSAVDPNANLTYRLPSGPRRDWHYEPPIKICCIKWWRRWAGVYH